MFGEFNEVAQPKTSLAKYSIAFNDLVVQMRLQGIAYLRLFDRPYTLLYVRRSMGRLLYLRLIERNHSVKQVWENSLIKY